MGWFCKMLKVRKRWSSPVKRRGGVADYKLCSAQIGAQDCVGSAE
jgi:hypothetical protein